MLSLTGLSVSTACNEQSTVLEPPVLNPLSHFNTDATPPSVSSTFNSLNPVCGITSYTITTGASDFDPLSIDLPDFTITLAQDKVSLLGLYEYQITAVADGGASAVVSG